ncbi:MAG TPA: response regulator transcription factor [Solirubrobacteraceae bacterium]|nr:response regulator transcription factor [Solirubrobacteraceae bacterium]
MTSRLHLAPDPGALTRPGSPIKIVLADDHATVRRNLRRMLDQEDGLEVIAEADDISTVMRHVPAHQPHVLVLDLRLPNGSSIATIRLLREQVPETEIVVLTMEESPAFAQQALEAGAVGFVIKDQADGELPTAIRRAVRGEEYVSPRVSLALSGLREAAGEDNLSRRETEILRLIALGFTSAEIGQQLSLSRRTVETHRAHIHRKLGLDTRAQLVRYALGRHLLDSWDPGGNG